MDNIQNFIDNGMDVVINTLDKKSFEINYYFELNSLFKQIINEIYLNHSSKQSILNTLVECCLNLEHSLFCIMNGFYENSMESLRKFVELVVFGIYFDKEPLKYTSWLRGSSEFRFKEKLDAVFNTPELRLWTSVPFFSSLNANINNLFKRLSTYTHSNPTKWQQTLRYTNHLEFNPISFDNWINELKTVLDYSTTLLVLYMPNIINEASSKLIDGTNFQSIIINLK